MRSATARFQLLYPLGLINLHSAVGFAPAEVGLFSHTNPLTDLADRLALPQQNVSLSQLVNDLFGVVAFLGIVQISSYGVFATLDLDEKFGLGQQLGKAFGLNMYMSSQRIFELRSPASRRSAVSSLADISRIINS